METRELDKGDWEYISKSATMILHDVQDRFPNSAVMQSTYMRKIASKLLQLEEFLIQIGGISGNEVAKQDSKQKAKVN